MAPKLAPSNRLSLPAYIPITLQNARQSSIYSDPSHQRYILCEMQPSVPYVLLNAAMYSLCHRLFVFLTTLSRFRLYFCHATESISSRACLKRSSLFVSCTLRSIKAGSSSNICDSCFPCATLNHHPALETYSTYIPRLGLEQQTSNTWQRRL